MVGAGLAASDHSVLARPIVRQTSGARHPSETSLLLPRLRRQRSSLVHYTLKLRLSLLRQLHQLRRLPRQRRHLRIVRRQFLISRVHLRHHQQRFLHRLNQLPRTRHISRLLRIHLLLPLRAPRKIRSVPAQHRARNFRLPEWFKAIQRGFRRLQTRPGRVARSRIRANPGGLRRNRSARPQAVLCNDRLRRVVFVFIFLRHSCGTRRVRHRRLRVLRLRKAARRRHHRNSRSDQGSHSKFRQFIRTFRSTHRDNLRRHTGDTPADCAVPDQPKAHQPSDYPVVWKPYPAIDGKYRDTLSSTVLKYMPTVGTFPTLNPPLITPRVATANPDPSPKSQTPPSASRRESTHS